MCGRASQYSEFTEIERLFGPLASRTAPKAQARYNAAPRQSLVIIRHDRKAGGRVAEAARWGLIPSWAKEAKIGDRSINARDIGEDGRGLDERPMFRDAWRAGQRCIVPLNSFFEWEKTGKTRRPCAVGLADGAVMAVAGLWEPWRDPVSREILRSFTIITTTANEALARIHARMPVILAASDVKTWLSGEPKAAKALLRPCPTELVRVWPVTPRINKAGDLEGPDCVAPLAQTTGGS